MGNILPNFKTALRRKNYKSVKEFAAKYDATYTHEKKGKSTTSKESTLSNIQSGTANPNLQTVLNICDILGCDLDYITGRMPEYTHTNKFIMEETGLSEESIELLPTLGMSRLNLINLLLEDIDFSVDLISKINSCYPQYKEWQDAKRQYHAESNAKKVISYAEEIKQKEAGASSISNEQVKALKESYEISRYYINQQFDDIIVKLLKYIYEDESQN